MTCDAQPSLKCPHCKTELYFEPQYGSLHCSSCDGGFVTRQTLADLLRELRGTRPNQYKPARLDMSAPIIRLHCPQCDRAMVRRNYGETSGVIVDVCVAHGVWFDRRELAQVLAFAASGAMDAAEIAKHKRLSSHKRLDDFAYRLREAGPKHIGWGGKLRDGAPLELSDLGAEPQPRFESPELEFIIDVLELVELG